MLTIHVFEIKEGKNAQKINELLGDDWGGGGGHSPPPSLYVKKGPGFCMSFYKQMSMIVCKGCFSISLTEISIETLRQKLRTMLNVLAIFVIFAISHHHSYAGVLHIWQSILKAINIRVIIFNYSL